MQRDADTALSNNEKEFIIQALKEEHRIDGRGPYELREPKFQFSLDDSSCTVLLGQTRVMTVITASLEAPYPDRPNEGSVRFNVEFSPMASPAFEAGRPGEEAIEVARLIERGLRESRAVDQEALVVVSGRKVWHLRVDVHVLDHQGNLVDACGLSALAALMAFRRPDVTVGGGEDGQAVTVHSPDVREPLPLSIHHLPVPVSFAFFEEGALMVADPGLKEEAASSGGLTVTLNPHGELCAVQKARGVGLPAAEIMRCIRIAAQKVEDTTSKLKKALEVHSVARVQARVRRRAGPAEPQGHLPGFAPAAAAAVAQQQQAQQQQAVAAGLPQPVQDILRQLDEEEEEEGGEAMQASDEEEQGAVADADGACAATGDGADGGQGVREGPGDDAMDSEPWEGAGAGLGVVALQHRQQQPAGEDSQQAEQQRPPGKKAKRKRRAAQPGSSPQGTAGEEGDGNAFQAIASLIAGAGGEGRQGLENAVKQQGARQRTPGSGGGKREKGGK